MINLQEICTTYALPSLSYAIHKKDWTIITDALWRRHIDYSEQVTTNDIYHIWSCSKSIFTLLVGKLVEQWVVDRNTTIQEILPDKTLDTNIKNISIKQLLSHTSWITHTLIQDKALYKKLHGILDPRKWRVVIFDYIKEQKTSKDKIYMYSNTNYCIAGFLLETITQKSVEELFDSILFRPLWLNSFWFWPCGISTPPKKTRWHTMEGISSSKDNPPALNPAGRLHCTPSDCVKILMTLTDNNTFLKESTKKEIQTKYSERYWLWIAILDTYKNHKNILYHRWSNTLNMCTVWIDPLNSWSVAIYTNQWWENADNACWVIFDKISDLHLL